ncbi:MAG: acyltransferase family protein [Janthinobacterium lividum]
MESSAATGAASRPSYLFVDTVRFWSMLGIVALHAIVAIRSSPAEGVFPSALECLFKYGTIGFFLISGFLLGDRMDVSAPRLYLSRRLKALLAPWIFWFGLYVLYLVVGDLSHQRLNIASASSWLHMIWMDLGLACFSTSFWFVPNLALGMCILLLFSRYLHSVKLGTVLFAVNLIYVANIYGEWFSPQHTSALFAFVSYLWLGSYVARNFSGFSRFLDSLPTAGLAAFALLSYVLSVAEVQLLIARHSADPFNTLRPCNQVLSVLVVLLLCKVKVASWPRFVNVRQQTFCIYLVHTFFLRIAYVVLNHAVGSGVTEGSLPSLSFLLRGSMFVFAYGGSLLVGHLISRSDRWNWIIGLKSLKKSGQRADNGVAKQIIWGARTPLMK